MHFANFNPATSVWKMSRHHHLLSIMVIKTPIHRSVSVTTSLHPSHFCACTYQEQDFQRHLSSSFFLCSISYG